MPDTWAMVQAIAAIAGTVATLVSCVVALYLGMRPSRTRLSGSTRFFEKSRVKKGIDTPSLVLLISDINAGDERLFGFDLQNTCNNTITITHVVERARFNLLLPTMIKRLSRLRSREFSMLMSEGSVKSSKRFGDVIYILPSPISINPGEFKSICFDFDLVKSRQEERTKAGYFYLDKPLKYWIEDITHKRYRVETIVTPNYFLTEGTCHVIKQGLFD